MQMNGLTMMWLFHFLVELVTHFVNHHGQISEYLAFRKAW